MNYDPEKHHRRSIRLPHYDYSSPGDYFITLCVQNRECLFGEINNGKMKLNEYGKIVEQCWYDLPNHYEDVELDEYVIMPDHFHGIVRIVKIEKEEEVGAIKKEGVEKEEVGAIKKEGVGAIHELPQPPQPITLKSVQFQRRKMTLPKLIGRFKMNSAKLINLLRNTPGNPVWQRNYYEHIIRDEIALSNIRNYIKNNPLNWKKNQNDFLTYDTE